MTRGKGSRMNYKQKVEYLSTYRFEVAKIESCVGEYNRWMTIGTKVNRAPSQDDSGGVGQSDGTGKVERAAVEMARLASVIESEMIQAMRNRDEIMRTIRTKSKNRRYALLLEMRYVDGKSINKISRSLEKSYKHVIDLVNKAVNTLDI